MPGHHVLHLVISLAPGGLERLVVDWTNARNRQWPGSTRVACLDERGELAGQVAQGAVTCLDAQRAKWPWDQTAVRRLTQLLGCHVAQLPGKGPDGQPSTTPQPNSPAASVRLPPVILHAHNLAAWQYAVLAKTFIRKSFRIVYTQHGANLHNLRLADRLRARLLACFTDQIVAVSEATARVMAKTLWFPQRRISVVQNGVGVRSQKSEVRSQKSEVRRKFGIPENALVIGSVGRLAQVKGQDRLIEAFARGVAEDANRYSLSVIGNTNNQERITSNFSHLLLVGDGPERANLERLVRDLGAAEHVIFTGYQADPHPYYDAMNLFVLPSRSEGLSISLLEAMSGGIPVAVTDVGANREVVDGGRCGLVLSDNDADWASQIKDVVGDPERLQAMSRRGRDRVEKDYSLEATLAGYEALYAS